LLFAIFQRSQRPSVGPVGDVIRQGLKSSGRATIREAAVERRDRPAAGIAATTESLAQYRLSQGASEEAERFFAEMEKRLQAGAPNLGEKLHLYLEEPESRGMSRPAAGLAYKSQPGASSQAGPRSASGSRGDASKPWAMPGCGSGGLGRDAYRVERQDGRPGNHLGISVEVSLHLVGPFGGFLIQFVVGQSAS